MPGQRPISADHIDGKFNDESIDTLAALMPEHIDRVKLGEAVRGDLRLYAAAALRPDTNELHHQIAALEKAASAHRHGEVGKLLEALYPHNREWLTERIRIRSRQWDKVKAKWIYPTTDLPTANDLNGDHADAVCDLVASLCRDGGAWVEGRSRPGGKRSPEWKPLLHIPKLDRNIRKVDAARDLVQNLSLTWAQITGDSPPDVTIHQDHLQAPFSKFVEEIFELADIRGVSAIRLMNDLNARRRERRFIEALIWKFRAPRDQWSTLPSRFGSPTEVRKRFEKWPERVLCRRLFDEMEKMGEPDRVIISKIIDETQRCAQLRAEKKSRKPDKTLKQLKKA